MATQSSISLIKSDILGYLNEFLPRSLDIFSCLLNNEEENKILAECRDNNVADMANNDVVVFAKVGCGYCERAKKCLSELQGE